MMLGVDAFGRAVCEVSLLVTWCLTFRRWMVVGCVVCRLRLRMCVMVLVSRNRRR